MGRFSDVLRKNWWVIVLLAIMVFGFYVRSGAMQYSDLPDIDTYYFVRMNEYVLSHNFQMPSADTMRNWPYGETKFDLPMNFYLPSAMYVMLNPALGLSFYRFAFVQPVILAAIAIVLFFFLARELFGCRLKAMFAAFFFAAIPAAITRLSAGEIEKEANSVVFMLLMLIFFFKALKQPNWKWKGIAYGVLSGVFLGITGSTWGGIQFVYIILSLFAVVLLLVNRPQGLWHSFVPMMLLGMLIQFAAVPQFTPLTSYHFLLAGFVVILVLIREAAPKFRLVKQESLKFLTPGLVILSFVGILVTSMFSDFVSRMIDRLWSMAMLVEPTLTTVAESIPGDWNAVVGQTGIQFALSSMPQIAQISALFSVWVIMILGAVVMAYKLARYRELILLFPILFLVFSIYGTFYGIRLAYFVGFAAPLAAGYLCGWLALRARLVKTVSSLRTTSLVYLVAAGFCAAVFVLTLSTPAFAASALVIALCLAVPGYAMRNESHESWIRRAWNRVRHAEEIRLDLIMIPVIVFVVILIAANAANASVYGQQLGPSINPYFNEAFKFMRDQTPENTSVLSWWDFGYWFQYVGKKATIVDGGGVGDTSRYDVAIWFTDDVGNWSHWTKWLNNKLDVGYILMDYTLPGKYGAISKIASLGTTVVGIMQFDSMGSSVQGNTTIQEFGAGPYRIWLPLTSSGNIAGTPVFLVTDGTRYANKAYINDLCTQDGIMTVGNETPSMGGCVAVTPYGFFYIPPEAEHTIFASLMFMDGKGLAEQGLDKVFDNGVIHIYDLGDTEH